jgi:hypothetical protein
MDMAMERGRVRIVEGNKLLKIVLENFSILERIIYQPQEPQIQLWYHDAVLFPPAAFS